MFRSFRYRSVCISLCSFQKVVPSRIYSYRSGLVVNPPAHWYSWQVSRFQGGLVRLAPELHLVEVRLCPCYSRWVWVTTLVL